MNPTGYRCFLNQLFSFIMFWIQGYLLNVALVLKCFNYIFHSLTAAVVRTNLKIVCVVRLRVDYLCRHVHDADAGGSCRAESGSGAGHRLGQRRQLHGQWESAIPVLGHWVDGDQLRLRSHAGWSLLRWLPQVGPLWIDQILLTLVETSAKSCFLITIHNS